MRRNGFTIIEVMVSMLVSSLVIMGAFAIFASQRPIFATQIQVQNSQQGLSLSMELIQRDFRRAGMGFGFCQKEIPAGVNVYHAQVDCFPAAAAAQQVLRAVEVTDGGTAGPDTLTISFAEPQSDGAADATLTTDVVSPFSGGTPNVDDARGFMTPLGCVGGGCTFPGATFAILYSPSNPWNHKSCTLVQVVNANTNPDGLTLVGRPAFPCSPALAGSAPPPAYTANADQLVNLGKLNRITYSIAWLDPNNPALVRDLNDGTGQQVIAWGIEDLQVVPACDTNFDGTIGIEGQPSLTNDDWFYNVAGDNTPATCTTFPMARISMVARSATEDAGFTLGARPALENRGSGGADQFHRRVMGAVVMAPNVGL